MADETIYELTQETAIDADDRFIVQDPTGAGSTRSSSATFALIGGMSVVDTGDASITAAVGEFHNWDTSSLTANRTFTLPTSANVGERAGFYVNGNCNSQWVTVLSGALGDLIGGLDCSSIAYRRLNTHGAFFVFRCVASTPDVEWVVDSRWQGTGFHDDPPDGLRPIIADDSTDNSTAIQALIDAKLFPVKLPPGDVRIGDATPIWLLQAPRSGAALIGAGGCSDEDIRDMGTTLKWDGTAGGFMINVGGIHASIRDIQFQGDITDTWAGGNKAGAAINIQRFPDEGIATGRVNVQNCTFRNLTKGFYCNDAAKQFVSADAAGESVSMSGTTITLSGGETFPTFAQNRLSGNAFTVHSIVINGTTYTIDSSSGTSTMTANESATEASDSAFVLTYYQEAQSAHTYLSDCQFRDVADCFICDNAQSYGHTLNHCDIVHGASGRTDTFINCQGGGSIQVTGGVITDTNVTALKLGTGIASGVATFSFYGLAMDDQATPFKWVEDDSSTRTKIGFYNCFCNNLNQHCSSSRIGSERACEIMFVNCVTLDNGTWTFVGNASYAAMIHAVGTNIGNADNIGNYSSGSNYIINRVLTSQDSKEWDEQTLTSGDATPDVFHAENWVCDGSTTITDFILHPVSGEGRLIRVRGNGAVDITHGSSIMLAGGATLTNLSADRVITLQYRGSTWYEV